MIFLMITSLEDYWSFLISRVLLGSSIHIVFAVFYVLVQVTTSGSHKLRGKRGKNLGISQSVFKWQTFDRSDNFCFAALAKQIICFLLLKPYTCWSTQESTPRSHRTLTGAVMMLGKTTAFGIHCKSTQNLFESI